MLVSPSEIKRIEDSGAKTERLNNLMAEIVDKLHGLTGQALLEVRAFLEVQIQEAKKALAKDTTKVYRK